MVQWYGRASYLHRVSHAMGTAGQEITLSLDSAALACLQFTFRTLENEPVRTRMAHVAIPKNESSVGFDHPKGMFTLAWLRHIELGMLAG